MRGVLLGCGAGIKKLGGWRTSWRGRGIPDHAGLVERRHCRGYADKQGPDELGYFPLI